MRAAPPPAAVESNVTHNLDVCSSKQFVGDGAKQKLDVAIFVFAWRRHASLKRLVDSLLHAEYCGTNRAAGRLSLTFILDVGASSVVEHYVRSVPWPHGPVRVVLEPGGGAAQGIRGMWIHVMGRELEAHEPPTAHLLPLEDDVELSPLWYWWLRRAHDAYGPFDATDGVSDAWGRDEHPHAKRLLGVSLYSPRLDEIAYPSRHWRPRWPSAAGNSPAFLFSLPCSWGALFFRGPWRRFLRFYAVRGAPPFYNASHEAFQKGKLAAREVLGDPALAIPRSRASTWPRSWKRTLREPACARPCPPARTHARNGQRASRAVPWA